jgi:hypothetical protein
MSTSGYFDTSSLGVRMIGAAHAAVAAAIRPSMNARRDGKIFMAPLAVRWGDAIEYKAIPQQHLLRTNSIRDWLARNPIDNSSNDFAFLTRETVRPA